MEKFYIGFAVAFCFVVAAFAGVTIEENALVKKVQTGELILTCLMHDGERVIDGGMVTGIFEGVWKFKNGQAKSCEVTEK